MVLCECKEDGFCPRYQRPMSGRLREICRGENIDPEKAAQYRALWLAMPATGTAPPPPERCPFLSRRARDPEGNVKTRWCATG